MAVELLKRDESIPAAYPAAPAGLSAAAAALDSDFIWARVEAYVAYRWSARTVIWTVEGKGAWRPDLTPATVTAVELWENFAWTAETLNASPLGGYELDGEAYRFTATVGDASPNDVPAEVEEAWRRLAEYLSEPAGKHGVSSRTVELGQIREEYQRSPSFMAKAMQYSGAGDLLRKFRRA